MRVGTLKNCMHCFTLKQGTVLIAMAQLFTCGIVITLCLLALTHAMDIEEMVARDSEDALEREAFEDENSMHLNTRRMEIAHHNATEKVYSVYCGLVFVVIHMASVIFLLYGVLINNRNFMTPWLFVHFAECVAMIIAIFLFDHKIKVGTVERLIFISVALIMSMGIFYCYFVVYSTYRNLNNKKGLTHEIHGVKKKYIHQPAECSKLRSQSGNGPHEV